MSEQSPHVLLRTQVGHAAVGEAPCLVPVRSARDATLWGFEFAHSEEAVTGMQRAVLDGSLPDLLALQHLRLWLRMAVQLRARSGRTVIRPALRQDLQDIPLPRTSVVLVLQSSLGPTTDLEALAALRPLGHPIALTTSFAEGWLQALDPALSYGLREVRINANLLSSGSSASIASAMSAVRLLRELGITVTAEHVSTGAQCNAAIEAGVDLVIGSLAGAALSVGVAIDRLTPSAPYFATTL